MSAADRLLTAAADHSCSLTNLQAEDALDQRARGFQRQ
jgi:hypothetical protein